MAAKRHHRAGLTVTGQVQGVGFRPFVYRLATAEALTGWVLNAPAGVTVEVQGDRAAVDRFVGRLGRELPPLASIVRCDRRDAAPVAGEKHFEIRPSIGGEMTDAQVTVDTATCEDCLRELRDAGDPRFAYPLINCTNCGPRYSIVRQIPYDRPNTTMAEFAMCPLCAGQYGDPGDRRFHAQPVACPVCGPAVWLVDVHGKQIECDDAVAAAAGMLTGGRIVAIKGLGGFQLCCRGDDEHAVGRLRRRKRRDAKPFALMASDLAAAGELVDIDAAAADLLAGPLRPIVLLPSRPDAPVAGAVADGLTTLGVMLAYTPLHHLLFDALADGGYSGPLVATSGNWSDEPLVKDNDSAIAHLGQIADAVLLHNRPIARRVDDSVVQQSADGAMMVLRRARGYAPRPVRLDVLADAPAVLAVGGELKNAVCLLRGGRAVVSEHIGDLKDGRTYRHFIDVIGHLEQLFDIQPQMLAADMHPQYLSTEYALRRHRGELAGREALPIIRVQHHHAHIVSCMADNGVSDPVIGLACDGVGYGDDGAVWGCEILRADLATCERLGHLRYLPLVGGDAAAAQPWRVAVAALVETFGEDAGRWIDRLAMDADGEQIDSALEMLSLGVSCPPASSLGRWFDAVAALAGVARANRYEGEAPMRLEGAIAGGIVEAYPFRLESIGPFAIDLRPMVEHLVADLVGGEGAGVVAAKFHNTVAECLRASALRAREQTGIATVALSGGCFANRYLTARLAAALAGDGFTVLRHRSIPCSDGGVALGQAVVAAARLQAGLAAGTVRSQRGK